jgi:hypothetical protein
MLIFQYLGTYSQSSTQVLPYYDPPALDRPRRARRHWFRRASKAEQPVIQSSGCSAEGAAVVALPATSPAGSGDPTDHLHPTAA